MQQVRRKFIDVMRKIHNNEPLEEDDILFLDVMHGIADTAVYYTEVALDSPRAFMQAINEVVPTNVIRVHKPFWELK
jgi:hypothetical protein